MTDYNTPVCCDLTLVSDGLQDLLQIHYLGAMTFRKLLQITFTDLTPDIPLLWVCSPYGRGMHVLSSCSTSQGLWRAKQIFRIFVFHSSCFGTLLETHFNTFLLSTILFSPKEKLLLTLQDRMQMSPPLWRFPWFSLALLVILPSPLLGSWLKPWCLDSLIRSLFADSTPSQWYASLEQKCSTLSVAQNQPGSFVIHKYPVLCPTILIWQVRCRTQTSIFKK